MDYWQLIRRLPDGGHQPIGDFKESRLAVVARDRHNADYQTDEYAVVHRTTDKLEAGLSDWWNGKRWRV